MFKTIDKEKFDSTIRELLANKHIPQNTQSWRDYEKAKRSIPVMANYKYNRAIRIICEWVKI